MSNEEGVDFARKHGCLFVETSAKTNIAVSQAFEELVLKILETPNLVDEGQAGIKLGAMTESSKSSNYCC